MSRKDFCVPPKKGSCPKVTYKYHRNEVPDFVKQGNYVRAYHGAPAHAVPKIDQEKRLIPGPRDLHGESGAIYVTPTKKEAKLYAPGRGRVIDVLVEKGAYTVHEGHDSLINGTAYRVSDPSKVFLPGRDLKK